MTATKKPKKTSPTQRAAAILRGQGYTYQIVERWNSFAKVRQDLFGVIDIVAITGSIVGIQVTTGDNHAARRSKILAEPRALAWIKAGGLLELWSFTLAGARGQVKKWTLRKEEIVEADFQCGSK